MIKKEKTYKKQLITILILITVIIQISLLIFSNNIYASYNYNENYTNLYLDKNGWCTNLDVTLTLFNKTEWENREYIEDNLCKEGCITECDIANCTECKKDCLTFQKFKDTKIEIYNGPLKSLGTLIDTNFDEDSKIKYTFTKPEQYLVEIFPTGNFNDYHEIFIAETCNFQTTENTNITKKIITLKNQTFNYLKSKLTLELKNTNINKSDEITVTENPKLDNKLNNTIQSFQILFPDNINLTNANVKINISNKINTTTNVYKYDNVNQKWDSTKFTQTNNIIVLSITTNGIFSITQKENGIELVTIINKTIQTNKNTQEIKNTTIANSTQTKTENNTPTPSKENNNNIYYYITTGIFISIIVISIIIMKKKSNTKPSSKPVEILTTYDKIYNKSKEYIKQYKPTYNKDQLYRGLQEAKVPKDIIDKAINEEY